MRLLTILATTGALFASATARADQCAINPLPITQKATAIVKPGATVLEYCEPCHDKAPGAPYKVTRVDSIGGKLSVNGKLQDLAYLFVQTAPDEFHNVGIATTCGAADVSEWLRSGKPSGPIARTPRPPGSPPPGWPPVPPPNMPDRATSPDDLAGVWSVKIHTRLSTCPGVTIGREEQRWTIVMNGSNVEVKTGTEDLVGLFDVANKPFKVNLHTKARPSGTAMQFNMYFKDSFSAILARSVPHAGGSRDPACVVFQDVMARREP